MSEKIKEIYSQSVFSTEMYLLRIKGLACVELKGCNILI